MSQTPEPTNEQRVDQILRQHFVPLYPADMPLGEMTPYEQGIFKVWRPILREAIFAAEARAFQEVKKWCEEEVNRWIPDPHDRGEAMTPTPEQLEQVQWIRDETMRRFDAGIQDEAIPANKQVVLEALSAAAARGAARERDACASYGDWLNEARSHLIYKLSPEMQEMTRIRMEECKAYTRAIRQRPGLGEEGT